ncbi:MAG TPA: class I SAM-dependent methyltransferase [Methylomusa anaerophila]|uniref:Putative methyltransferase YcgJ n=1 Tax=Methylomusa anaerophila TaxID=1930071 RepID=A0A348AEU3_9FIRM|nr:class I SAM-dependent methyltransferase [Methylomusa anaerophila]BBB89591.1 putative methyltransferase YcgJ [Methylomusa anaerophila]HML89636.1 class I SAM-dependent methyltransferase [Methylomusa anaerophila]
MDSKMRFSGRVDNYVKYRPAYAREFIDYLVKDVGVSSGAVVADVGAGTGIFTKQLADKVKTIYAVEPNANMRAACIDYCQGYDSVLAVNGSAEDTALPDQSVDFITAAQAFHWFDADKTKKEFQRIVKPNGKVILVWNTRDSSNNFIKEHNELCSKLCPDYKGISENAEKCNAFFRKGQYDYRIFENNSILSLESYIGNTLSASYALNKKDKNFRTFIDSLTAVFEKYSINGKILLLNNTHSYVGEV